jgi:CBS domain-containing protein/anti-sigma regulatory factor (Ser/Thr protein kinase)
VPEDQKLTRVQVLAREVKVSEVMARDVLTVSPQDRMSELRSLLKQNRISGAPVLDAGRLVGIVSIEDFINWLSCGEPGTPIEKEMSKNVQTLYPDESLAHAVAQFDRHGFGRFPVIDRETGAVLGMLTKGDIAEGLLKRLEADYHGEEILRYRASHIFEDIVADEAVLTLRYRVVGQDFGRAGRTAGDLRKTLKRLNVHPGIIRRVAIATYEAEMNMVVFSEGGQITAEVTPDHIRVEARDSGPGIADIEQAMEPGYSTAPDSVREMGFGAGMGLTNIQKCSDEMNLTSSLGQGTLLELILTLEH